MPGEGPYVRNITTLRELVAMYYGGLIQCSPVESDYSPTNVALALGANKGQRLGFTISNTGAQNAAIAFNSGVTLTTGLLLLQGGSLTLDWFYDQDVVFFPLWVISNSTGTTIHMVERVLSGG